MLTPFALQTIDVINTQLDTEDRAEAGCIDNKIAWAWWKSAMKVQKVVMKNVTEGGALCAGTHCVYCNVFPSVNQLQGVPLNRQG